MDFFVKRQYLRTRRITMPRPIRETPILFGEDGKRFEEKMRNAKCTVTPEQ